LRAILHKQYNVPRKPLYHDCKLMAFAEVP
jgi:hypothetical protein